MHRQCVPGSLFGTKSGNYRKDAGGKWETTNQSGLKIEFREGDYGHWWSDG